MSETPAASADRPAARTLGAARVRKGTQAGIYADEMVSEGAKLAKVSDGLADGDFEFAVLPERQRLYALAVTITHDAAEAEDAIQETLLAAWRSWQKARDPSRPGPWLTRICVNQCLRKRARRSRPLSFDDPTVLGARGIVSIQLDGRLIDFGHAFAQLSARQRAVFALHVHYGYTVDECAKYIGCRPGTARSHLGRAVAKLRRQMSNA